jgi:RHS repeat-associated protein
MRDGFGQDYADQRYYNANMGAFWSPDPTSNNWDSSNPVSWNLYAYTNGDPINLADPDGTDCSTSLLDAFPGIPTGATIGSLISQNSDLAIYAETIFTEASIGSDQNAANEKAAIAAVISNRWQFVNGYYNLYTGPVGSRASKLVRTVPDWGTADGTIASIVFAPGQFAVWASPDKLTGSAQQELNAALNSSYGSADCDSLVQAIGTAAGFMSVLNEHELDTSENGIIFTSFGSGGGANKSYYETTIGSYGSANVFYGVNASQVSTAPAAPPPSPRRPPRPRRPPH